MDLTKQINEILMEYSIYDALQAGFNKVVFIIKPEMEELMENRENYIRQKGLPTFYPIDNMELTAALAFPIIASGDIGGAVIFLENESGDYATDTEIKLAQVAAAFLGKQMEE